ncbi:MAG: DUF2065 domain-containing protein [Gammaproteobacteria bacterium]|nr:DUF2065 domain-containing protein [Gammaproteobacteria bacterium]
MLHDLAVALALVLVLEGLLPFASPPMLRQALDAMSQLTDSQLRLMGFVSMLLGVLLLFLVNP